jgi:uncharacterized surface protein with fasciclin (FAS1) repeats
MNNIIETAAAAGNFKTLATALSAGGLLETLKGAGPFTVFAPTDAAFAKIPKADLDALLANKEKLTKVLKMHVVAGKVMATDVVKLKDGAKVQTLEGGNLTVHLKGSEVKLNDSLVSKADIDSSNGVIHVIDTVLMPS